jgi:flagellar biosynthetic protein FliR
MILGTLIFLALDAHLVLIQVLVDSFTSMPIGPMGLSRQSFLEIVLWGSRVFAGGLLIALPAMMTITMINIIFGVMTRASPQLNIFAVGFPTTMAAGFLVLVLTLPNLLPRFTSLIHDAFNMMQRALLGG